jgi:hypothetical protein
LPASLVACRCVEVGGHRHDGLRHRVAEIVFRRLLHLLQDHRRDLGGRVALALHLDRGDVVDAALHGVRDALNLLGDFRYLAPHEALDGEDGVLRVGHGLALRDLADEALTVLAEPDDRRRRATALGVWDDDGVAPLHHRHDGVGRAQVDADHLVCHWILGVTFWERRVARRC